MTRTVFQYIILALFCLFFIAAFHGRAPLWKRLLIAGIPVVCCTCYSVTLGPAWMGDRPYWHNLVATLVYTLFWLVFTWMTHRSRFMRGCCLFFSCAMLAAGVTGLAVRAWDWDILTFPALLLTPFSSIPMYGLRLFLDWTGLELVSILLSSFWLGYTLFLWRAKK